MFVIDFAAWGWPQWLWIAMTVVSIVLSAFLHGHPKTGNHSVVMAIVTAPIGLFILYMGGFFS